MRAKSTCSCINVRRAANSITGYYDQMLNPTGITLNQYSLLKNLSNLGPCSTSKLAEYVGLERSTLVRTIKPLFLAGLMEDIAPAKSRNRMIQVTEEGKEILAESNPLWEKAQEGVEAKVGAQNLLLLMQLLDKIEEL